VNDENLLKAYDLPASVKLMDGEFESITVDEVIELFTAFSKSGQALVPFKVIADLLNDLLECSDVETNALRQHLNVAAGGLVSAQQFHRAMNMVSIRTLLKHVHQDMLQRRDLLEHKDVHVERDFFVNRVNWRVDRDDAFATLPMACLYLLIFMCLVVYHLQIWRRQELERGIESWMVNSGKNYYGPYLSEHVYLAYSGTSGTTQMPRRSDSA
jgi:hypothetical protein